MKARARRLVAVILAFAGASLATLAAQPSSIPVEAILEHPGVRAGSSVRGVLRVEIPPELHVQSNTPRDPSLIPTTLSFAPPAGVTIREVVFPNSTDIELPGYPEPLAVYGHTLLIGVEFVVSKDTPPGTLTIPSRFLYQACDDRQCFRPTTRDVSWAIEVLPAGAPVPARQRADVFGPIRFGRGVPAPTFVPEPPAPPVVVPQNNDELLALFDEFEVAGTGAYMTKAEFLTFIDNAEAGVKPQGMLEGQGPFAILVLVFLGGLALNLTPCVLPMIPINLAIIGAGAQSGRRGRGFVLGSAYGAAMALVYGVLGLVVILTAGTFGSINASPWFNASLAVLFIVLALAMFDIINIDFSRLSSRIQFKQESRGSVGLAFGMGAVAALLAGACVAPVVIQVVVFASERYAAGVPVALALPFVLGLGMALPWPIAGAGMAALPKPGMWMVRVKQAMGVFILATAAYYGYVAYEGFANRWVDPASVSAGVESQIKSGWKASLAQGLTEAKRDGKPVLVDFWATWCKNCLVMDETTLVDPDVVARLTGYVKIKVQTEDPDASPNKELLKRIGAIGLPAYAILRKK
jgi:thiol:disulfide interchange protein DsbD